MTTQVLPLVSALAAHYGEMNDAERGALMTLMEYGLRRGETFETRDDKSDDEPTELPSLLGGLRTANQDGPAPTLADELLKALPDMLAKFPKGPSLKQAASWLDADIANIRSAFAQLASSGRAATRRRGDTHALHLTPLDYESPPEDLTAPQAQVLRALDASAPDGVSPFITYSGLAASAGVSQGGIRAIVSALAAKKAIKITEQTTQGVMAQVLRRPA